MKNRLLVLVLVLGVLWQVAQAAGAGDKALSFFMHGGGQQYAYTEFAPQDEGGGILMNIAGLMWGVDAGAAMRHSWAEQMVKFAYFRGINTRYDGATQDGVPHRAPSSDYYFSTEYRIAPYIIHKDRFRLQADLGLGHRFLHNLVDQSYRRSQHYLYVVAGLNGEVAISPSMALFSTAHYLGLIRGWHKTYLSDIGYDRDLDFTQESGGGCRFELGFRKDIWAVSMEILAYYEFWNIDDSNFLTAKMGDRSATFFEPKNHTNAYGLQIGGVYRF